MDRGAIEEDCTMYSKQMQGESTDTGNYTSLLNKIHNLQIPEKLLMLYRTHETVCKLTSERVNTEHLYE